MIVLKNYVSKKKPPQTGGASAGYGLAPARKDKMEKINTHERRFGFEKRIYLTGSYNNRA